MAKRLYYSSRQLFRHQSSQIPGPITELFTPLERHKTPASTAAKPAIRQKTAKPNRSGPRIRNSQLARKMKSYINKRKANSRQNRIHVIDSAIANSDSDPNVDDLTDPDPTAKFEKEDFYDILRQMAAEMNTKEEETATA
jgi:hypothetical protein